MGRSWLRRWGILFAGEQSNPNLKQRETATNEIPKHPIFIQYRGKGTEEYAHSLRNIKVPRIVIMTLRKLKTVLPSLKAAKKRSSLQN